MPARMSSMRVARAARINARSARRVPEEDRVIDPARPIRREWLRALSGLLDQQSRQWQRHRTRDARPDPRALPCEQTRRLGASALSSWESDGYRVVERAIREIYGEVVVTPGLMIAGSDSRHYGKVADDSYRFKPMVVSQAGRFGDPRPGTRVHRAARSGSRGIPGRWQACRRSRVEAQPLQASVSGWVWVTGIRESPGACSAMLARSRGGPRKSSRREGPSHRPPCASGSPGSSSRP